MLAPPAPPQCIDRDWIARHMRHAGAMCLIDAVAAWDLAAIRCSARTHTAADNPLRAEGRLGAMIGVEYGAQAAAIHGAILACPGGPLAEEAAPLQGVLVAARKLEILVERLDRYVRDLEIVAERTAALPGGATYRYVIRHESTTLQIGQLTLKFASPAAHDRRVDS
jgi:predicted hotdog family 3-hydroxylacyl-ACP dehydratase